MPDVAEIPAPLRQQPVGDDRYRMTNTGDADQRDVVFGGQLLAPAIVAAALRHPGKAVRSIPALRDDLPVHQGVSSGAARLNEPSR